MTGGWHVKEDTRLKRWKVKLISKLKPITKKDWENSI